MNSMANGVGGDNGPPLGFYDPNPRLPQTEVALDDRSENRRAKLDAFAPRRSDHTPGRHKVPMGASASRSATEDLRLSRKNSG